MTKHHNEKCEGGTRRELLALMGLAGAASVALTPEAMAQDGLISSAGYPTIATISTLAQQERVARALRMLADACDRGEVVFTGMRITTELGKDEWLNQSVVLDVEVLGLRDA